MNLEILGLCGVVLVVFFAFAETERKSIIGVFASMLLLLLGAWIIIDGIQTVTGSIGTTNAYTVYTGTDVAGANCSNVTYGSAMNVTTSQNTTYTLTDVTLPQPPFPTWVTFKILAALICFLMGMFGMLHYADRIMHNHEGSR